MELEINEMKEIIGTFVDETRDSVVKMNGFLQRLRDDPADREALEALFRGIHSLKGTSGFLGLMNLGTFSHRLEEILKILRNQNLPFEEPLPKLFHKSVAVIGEMIEKIARDGTDDVPCEELLKQAAALSGELEKAAVSPPQQELKKKLIDEPDAGADLAPKVVQGFDEFTSQEIVEGFVQESREILDKLNLLLVELEQNPRNENLINDIFRAFHTLKGNSAFVGFGALEKLAHAVEDLLNKLRRRKMILTPAFNDVLLSSLDVIQSLLNQFENGEEPGNSWQALVKKCQNLQSESPEAEIPSSPAPEKDNKSLQISFHENTIRVSVQRLDKLMNLVGELVLARNRMNQVIRNELLPDFAVGGIDQLGEVNENLDFLITEIQEAVIQTRMVPIAKVFNKFPRLIRDLARQSGKDIRLEIEGAETEVDKSVSEVIGDPLLHILRNAIDHGIEPPEERQAAGKPREGVIRLNACHNGNTIEIHCRDDGRGIDPRKVLAKALEKKLVTPEQSQNMQPGDILNLIFMPGFSTAEAVTNISGRGVGLDVVKNNISRLNGFIEIHSQPGKGTAFHLRFPLSMAIIQGLVIRVQEEIFIIPVNAVVETLRFADLVIQPVNGRQKILFREQLVPLVYPEEIFQLPANGGDSNGQYLVVAGHGEKKIGLVVDQLIGQKEVVIKPLSKYLTKIPGISGATIMEDGKVRLIIDIGDLMRQESYDVLQMAGM